MNADEGTGGTSGGYQLSPGYSDYTDNDEEDSQDRGSRTESLRLQKRKTGFRVLLCRAPCLVSLSFSIGFGFPIALQIALLSSN